MNSRREFPETGGDLLTLDDSRIAALMQTLDRVFGRLELMAKNCKPLLNGEHYLTDSEASARLKVSRQTLQDYRNDGKIPFCRIGGKILYRESDLQRMLDNSYREAYR